MGKWKTAVLTSCIVAIGGIAILHAEVDTSGWKSYRDEAMGFEVKIPPGWSDANKGRGVRFESVNFAGRLKPNGPIVTVTFGIQRGMNPKGLSISQWYADQAKAMNAGAIPATDVRIGGQQAIRLEMQGNLRFFTLLNANDILDISFMQPGSAGEPIDPSFINILNTVQFLSKS